MDEAMRSFEGVLAQKPTNLVALLGKVPIQLNVSKSTLTVDRDEFFIYEEVILKPFRFSSKFCDTILIAMLGRSW